MKKERFERIKKIFQEALSLDPSERDAFLAQACGGDSELLTKVKQLLQRESESKSFLETPVVTGVSPEQTQGDRIGTRIGQYLIKRIISTGGMGTVFEAVQPQPERSVAVKVMNQGLASQSAIRRFEYEAKILARLRHPNIAQIIEAGTFREREDDDKGEEAGLPYFVMEYIPDALPLTDYAQEKNLSTRERLELFTHACRGVHHGHQKGIIHRDLKPGNILVDGEGQVKIIDFGVARATDSDMALTTIKTEVGQLIGTLQYMSPEQCEADPHNLDVRSDVYALGVVLFELLCEEPPYDVRKAVVFEAVRLIRETPPKKPSTTKKYLSGDVETIVLKALEKERAHRYQSIADFAEDIDRHLSGRVILARPAGVMTRTWKYARRNPVISVVVGSVLLFSIIIGLYIILWSYPRLQSKQADLEQEMVNTEMINNFLEEMLTWIDPIREGTGVGVLGMLDRAAARIDGEFPDRPLIKASLRHTLGVTYMNNSVYTAAEDQLDQSLATFRELLGEDHERTLTAIYNLAFVHINQGRIDEAEKLLLDLLDRCQRLFGAVHRQTEGARTELAMVRMDQGRYEEAESLYLESLEGNRRLLGDDHRNTLGLMNSLVSLYRTQERFEEAEELLNEIHGRTRSLLGEDHMDTIACQVNLASLYKLQGRFEEAEQLYLDAIEKTKRLLGPDHDRLIDRQSALASLYYEMGRFEEAESLFLLVIEKGRRVLGSQHPENLKRLNNLATMHIDRGRFEEAEPMMLEVLEGRRRVLGERHHLTLSSMSTLACLYVEQSRYADAEPLLRKALTGLRNCLGEDHGDTVIVRLNLLRVYSLLGRNEEAEPLQKRVVEQLRNQLGDDHPDTLKAVGNLAIMHQRLGRFEESEAGYLEVLEGFRRKLGKDHPSALSPLNNLATLYLDQKQFDKAEQCFLEVQKGLHRLVGENHPNSLTVLNSLAVLYERQGRTQKAEACFLEAIEKTRRVLGDRHFSTVNAIGCLGSFYASLERYDDAEPHLVKALEGRRSILGDEHPHTVQTIEVLTDLYEEQNRFEEALRLSKELVSRTPEDSDHYQKRKEQLDRITEQLGRSGSDR